MGLPPIGLPVEIGLQRKQGGGGDAWNRMERKGLAFHERVRAGYLDMAAQESGRWVVVDAVRGIHEIQATVRDLVTTRQLKGMIVKGEGAG